MTEHRETDTAAAPDDGVYIFNHIEKCGGVSFAMYLMNRIRPDDHAILMFPGTIDAFYKDLSRGRFDAARRLYLYTHFASNLREFFPDRRIRQLTLLREPWSRFASAYAFSQGVAFFPKLPFGDFFRGASHNFMTLTIGDGSLDLARERLERQYEFFGLTEEYDRSMLMLAHTLGFDSVDYVHTNKSGEVAAAAIPPGMRDLFYERNGDDVALYRFARDLFEKRWKRLEPELRDRALPCASDGASVQETINRLTMHFKNERQPEDSFLFAPYRRGDRTLQILWGILYRLIPLTQMYELLGQGRFAELRLLLDNLEAYHRECPFAHPLVPEIIAYFRMLTPRGLEALIGRVLMKLRIDTSKAQERRLGPRMPYGLLNFMDFVDTGTMLALFKSLEEDVDLEGEIRKLLDD